MGRHMSGAFPIGNCLQLKNWHTGLHFTLGRWYALGLSSFNFSSWCEFFAKTFIIFSQLSHCFHSSYFFETEKRWWSVRWQQEPSGIHKVYAADADKIAGKFTIMRHWVAMIISFDVNISRHNMSLRSTIPIKRWPSLWRLVLNNYFFPRDLPLQSTKLQWRSIQLRAWWISFIQFP